MLRAKRLTPKSVLQAMQRGDFYASTGVELEQIEYNPDTQMLEIAIRPDADATFVTEFIGTPISFDRSTTSRMDPSTGETIPGILDYSADVGRVSGACRRIESDLSHDGPGALCHTHGHQQ